MKACNRCGGLLTTEEFEYIAGTMCNCPPAAPVGDDVACEDCGAPYGKDGWCDVVVPDEFWSRLSAKMLCFRCMTKRFQALGIKNVPVIVASGPYAEADNEKWRMDGWNHGHAVAKERFAQAAPVGDDAINEGRPVRVQGAGAENVAVRSPDKGEAAANVAAGCLSSRSVDPTPSPTVGDDAVCPHKLGERELISWWAADRRNCPLCQAARIAELEQRNAEVAMLSYKWMERHDRIAAGQDGGPFPSPTDLPEAIGAYRDTYIALDAACAESNDANRQLAAAQARIAELERENEQLFADGEGISADRDNLVRQLAAAQALNESLSARVIELQTRLAEPPVASQSASEFTLDDAARPGA